MIAVNAQTIYTILVVDDEVTEIEQMQHILPKDQFRLLRAVNGATGCLLAKKRQPDLIIMDWQMPKMNGIEALTKLKQDPTTTNIPVIMASGIMIDSTHLATALKAGAIDFVQKPCDPIELQARLNAALQLSKAMQEINTKNQHLQQQQQELIATNEELVEQMQLVEDAYADKEVLMDMIGRKMGGALSHTKSLIRLMMATEIDKKQQYYLTSIQEYLLGGEEVLQEVDIKLGMNKEISPTITTIDPLAILHDQIDQVNESVAPLQFNIQAEQGFEVQADDQYIRYMFASLLHFTMDYSPIDKQAQFAITRNTSYWEIRLSYHQALEKKLVMKELFQTRYQGFYTMKLLVKHLNGQLTYEVQQNDLYISIQLPLHEPLENTKSEKLVDNYEREELDNVLLELVEIQKAFTNPKLSIEKLATQLGLSGTELSYFIYKKYGENFKTFINRYRVTEAKKLLLDNHYDHYTYLGIGYEAGFNSKSAFYRVFKNMTGLTPKAYKQQAMSAC